MRIDANGNTYRQAQQSDRFIYAGHEYTVIDTTEHYICAIMEGNWGKPCPWENILRDGPGPKFKAVVNDVDYIW